MIKNYKTGFNPITKKLNKGFFLTINGHHNISDILNETVTGYCDFKIK